ncbi:MAG: 2-hydroxyacyl-CoA dehydratase [Clostridium sp.]|nr:2-hydroxyacyl-CoA dehydratase [Clostridium sp.]MCM1547271.1 2-hydroxyacyl-CoA dehydratase [Ruminococcus sp.]
MDYPVFKEEMKHSYTILVPDMLPVHFKLIINILKKYGYNVELLQTSTREVVDEGLKNVHNDTCYPALLVIGQFINALKSGKYDVDKTALMLTQTGGGCRASNYIHLLRKALKKEFPQVPVISLNLSGLEKGSGLTLTLPLLIKVVYAVFYGDLLMSLYNQCKPYEIHSGDSEKMREKWQNKLKKVFDKREFLKCKKYCTMILDDFASIERIKEKKIRVGIVGEIYVKYSPLANNHLEEFLLSEGCEPIVPALMEFVMYCLAGSLADSKLYNFKNKKIIVSKIGYDFIHNVQKTVIKTINDHGVFEAPHDFEHIRKLADKYISQGVNMGEGWLIPAEMAALAETGTENIICTQPFGCLPNHIVAKGMSRVIKEAYPGANIVAIDYDPGATKVNQENRIKLMLANAKK